MQNELDLNFIINYYVIIILFLIIVYVFVSLIKTQLKH